MEAMYSTVLALRTIIAVFLERTVGRFLIAASLLAGFIAGLTAYYAMNGASLLWIIVTLILALLLFLLLFTAIAFIAIFKLLPRKLTADEKRQVSRFSKTLLERLQAAHAPLPLLVWHLVVQALINQRNSDEKRHLQTTIEHSHSLSHEFKKIRRFFEID